MVQWYTPSTGPRPWSIGTGSCSILFTDYSRVEGREGTQAAILYIRSIQLQSQCTLTLYNLTLQFAVIHQSPGQRVVQILGADALASSDMRQAEHWAAAGGRVKKFCLHLIHWRLTSGIWWYAIVVMWWGRVTGWWHPSHTIHNAS